MTVTVTDDESASTGVLLSVDNQSVWEFVSATTITAVNGATTVRSPRPARSRSTDHLPVTVIVKSLTVAKSVPEVAVPPPTLTVTGVALEREPPFSAAV